MNDLQLARGADPRSALPLYGVRIIECTHAMAGPYATSLMGDLGAEVIKVEAPSGDFLRKMDEKFGPGESIYFHSINRSKRSISVDLKTPEGKRVLERLLKDADVFITNLRGSAVRHLGLDYESVAAARPEVVYCSITAFGETGPRAAEPGLDLLGQAVSGIMGMTGENGGSPVRTGPSITDIVTAFLLCFSVTTGLRARDRDGVGQKIELNLADSGFATMPNLVGEYLHTNVPIRPAGSGHPQAVPYQAFMAADGYFVIACLSDGVWGKVCKAIGDYVPIAEARYLTNTGRLLHREELVSALETAFADRDRAFWLSRLKDAGVPCAPVNTLEEAISDPQIVHNDMLLSLSNPRLGDYTVINNPIKFSKTPAMPYGYAPAVGEHSVDIMTEVGFTKEEVTRLIDQQVIFQQPEATTP